MTDIDIESMTLHETRSAAQELLDGTTGDLVGADAERFQVADGPCRAVAGAGAPARHCVAGSGAPPRGWRASHRGRQYPADRR